MTAVELRRNVLGALGAAVLFCLSGCVPSALPPSVPHRLVGRKAPGFSRTATSSREVSVPAGGRTRVTVIDFWASWCEPCQQSMPALNDLYQSYKRDGVLVIGVSVDVSASEAEYAARRLGAGFPIVVDPGLGAAYGVSRIPLTFVVDRSGTVRWAGRDPGSAKQAALYLLNE